MKTRPNADAAQPKADSKIYDRVYADCQNGGMTANESHEMATDHSTRAQSKAAHTWHWEFHPHHSGNPGNAHPIALVEDGKDILLITGNDGAVWAEISPKHQTMIAAAPELLDALYNITTWLEADAKGYCAKELHAASLDRHLYRARAAIAKATQL